MTKKYSIIGLIVLAVIAGVIWAIYAKQSNDASLSTGQDTSQDTSQASDAPTTVEQERVNPKSDTEVVTDCQTAEGEVTITYQEDSFSPDCVQAKPGIKIKWVNKDSVPVQVGIDPHPSHTGNKEISNSNFVLSITAGETATSTLTTTGKHSYHNHLNPTATGLVVVE